MAKKEGCTFMRRERVSLRPFLPSRNKAGRVYLNEHAVCGSFRRQMASGVCICRQRNAGARAAATPLAGDENAHGVHGGHGVSLGMESENAQPQAKDTRQVKTRGWGGSSGIGESAGIEGLRVRCRDLGFEGDVQGERIG
eukprot:4547683-Pleurochrysis_carterae.AAC.1